MDKYCVIAPVGDNLNALFIGIKEFPTEKVYLITPPERVHDARKVKKDLEQFHIPIYIHEVKGNFMEEIFREVAEIKQLEGEHKIIINIATGDRLSTCAALSASFVNGLKAFGIVNNQPMLMPILKFSYYKMLTDKKIALLKLLSAKEHTFEQLSKKTGMSPPLISYHIHGTLKSEGLKNLGLIELVAQNGKTRVQLTMLGKLLIKGYISNA